MKDCYRGDVFVPVSEKDEWRRRLSECGMIVGPWEGEQFDNCVISFEDFPKIDGFWGTIYWNLYPSRME